MRLQNLAVSAAVACLTAVSAHAGEDGRFRLEKSADGYVRMDTQTGAMSICEEKAGQLVCRVAADERAAFQDEIERLQSSLSSLDARVAKLENSLASRLESSLPTEEDFNKTMSYMERFLRGFMGIVKDMEKEEAPPEKPLPQRT